MDSYTFTTLIFSGMLVLATIFLVIANFILLKKNERMLKTQEKLMILNFITNVSDKIRQDITTSGFRGWDFFTGFFNAIRRAIPEFEDEIKSWYKGDERFESYIQRIDKKKNNKE